jgi:UDP-N-acetylmuramoyl-tripeptide--D-alanyl-D-alanine ligase
VLREEADIFADVPVAIVPSAQPEVAEAARERGAGRVVMAGLASADVMAQRWALNVDGTGELVIDDTVITVPLRGEHNLRNAMLALAVGRTFGLSDQDSARGISAAAQPPMRSAWQTIGRVTVINDAYNANPASMRAAFALLAGLDGGAREAGTDAASRSSAQSSLAPRAPSQRVAILGSMRELGDRAQQYHDDVARAALASPADLVAGVGDMADALRRVAANDPRVVTAADVDELWPLVQPRLASDATILLKASRGMKLERLLPYITTWATA